MNKIIKTDICIIGAGSGGLSVAAGSAQLGAKVVLIEAEKMGGDCLNFGCIPSKSLLAAAKVANQCQLSHDFGLTTHLEDIQVNKVMDYVHSVIQKIAPHDSVQRFESLGVKVLKGKGQFMTPNSLIIDDTMIQSRHFVIASGSSPFIPPIEGLENVKYYTNENIFNLSENPDHLIIIGGGPIGCEMAQAFVLLGIKVTLIEAFEILPKDDPELVGILKNQLIAQGLHLFEKTKVKNISQQDKSIQVFIEKNDANSDITSIQGSHLLIATGRKPNVDLNLDAAHVHYTSKGIVVDKRLRTSNKRIYAIGDVIGGYQFTHIANYHAGIVIRNILFKIPAKVNINAMPWVTYTHPELAHSGLSLEQVDKLYPDAKTISFPLIENDRAQTEHDTVGKIKVTVSSSGRILSVNILAPQAGELLLPWILAINQKQNIRAFSNLIVPYPTLSEMSKSVSGEFFKPILFSKKIKYLVKLLNFFN